MPNSPLVVKILKMLFFIISECIVLFFTLVFASRFVDRWTLFSFNTEIAIRMGILIFILLLINSVAIGLWEIHEQYLLNTIPAAICVFLVFSTQDTYYAVMAMLIVILLQILNTMRSSSLLKNFIKPNFRVTLHSVNRGLILVVSLTGALMFYINYQAHRFDIGEIISQTVSQPIRGAIQKEITDLQEGDSTLIDFESFKYYSVLQSLGLDKILLEQAFGSLDPKDMEVNIQQSIETYINQKIDPYKSFIRPLVAVAVFGIFEFIGGIVFLLWGFVINPVFWFFRKVGILKVDLIAVNKEVWRF